MKVRAKAKYILMSPRKTRLVVNLVRGLSIEEARRQLLFSKKAAAKPVLKVLESAIANAQNNFDQDTSEYRVVEAYVDEGPTFHRFTPKAHGRANPVRYRMSHIVITVGDGSDEKIEKKAAPVAVKELGTNKKETVKKTKVTKKAKVEKEPVAKS